MQSFTITILENMFHCWQLWMITKRLSSEKLQRKMHNSCFGYMAMHYINNKHQNQNVCLLLKKKGKIQMKYKIEGQINIEV
jgi:hypothetical protein